MGPAGGGVDVSLQGGLAAGGTASNSMDGWQGSAINMGGDDSAPYMAAGVALLVLSVLMGGMLWVIGRRK